jgi:predicted HTH domain antitoxin
LYRHKKICKITTKEEKEEKEEINITTLLEENIQLKKILATQSKQIIELQNLLCKNSF